MNTKVLEVNVDDLNMGGVFNLVKNVILNRDPDIQIDIAAIERFANVEHKRMFQKLGTEVYDIGYDGNKWKKQLVCYWRLKKLLKTGDYDAVHIHGDVANKLLVSGLAAKHGKVKKIILHSHASGVDGNHRAMKILIHKLCRNLLKNVGSEYVACSDLAAEWMFPHIKKEQIVIVNNGVDLDRFRFCKEIREIQRKKGEVSFGRRRAGGRAYKAESKGRGPWRICYFLWSIRSDSGTVSGYGYLCTALPF